jgi:hypothetical protein
VSRTDKDAPYWVRTNRDGIIEHDHRRGTCVPEDPFHSSGGRPHGRKNRHAGCAHYEVYTKFCTPEEVARQYWRRHVCLTPRYVEVWEGGQLRVVARGLIACVGHEYWRWNPDVSCRCDDVPTPTCSWGLLPGDEPNWYNDPSADVNLYDRRPIRQKTRTDLEASRRRYNGGDTLEDWDFVERSPWRGSW